jgi:hypothetical protein
VQYAELFTAISCDLGADLGRSHLGSLRDYQLDCLGSASYRPLVNQKKPVEVQINKALKRQVVIQVVRRASCRAIRNLSGTGRTPAKPER